MRDWLMAESLGTRLPGWSSRLSYGALILADSEVRLCSRPDIMAGRAGGLRLWRSDWDNWGRCWHRMGAFAVMKADAWTCGKQVCGSEILNVQESDGCACMTLLRC